MKDSNIDKEFVTSRYELWEELCLSVPNEIFVKSDGSRHYMFGKEDWIDNFHRFCAAKERVSGNH